MSRHEGVTCDSCLKVNFRGKRYKCLICYDYDLCATCFEAGATTTRHTPDHPMQCILTRTDFDLYYGSEALTADQPQAFTCPFCGRMGYTEASLQDHVTADHPHASTEVVCPICASLPGGDPNHVTDDFGAHLALEHRAPRDFDEPMGSMRHVRRIQHPGGRGMGGTRSRRNMAFQPGIATASSTMSGLSPRETMDPIAELLSQLSSVRNRAAAAQNVSTQLQQLEMQLQSTRAQLERLPRRIGQSEGASKAPPACQASTSSLAAATQPPSTPLMDFALFTNPSSSSTSSSNSGSQFLLSRLGEPEVSESDRQVADVERADRAAFIHELLLSTLSQSLRLDSDDSGEEPSVETPRVPSSSDEDRGPACPPSEPEGGGVDVVCAAPEEPSQPPPRTRHRCGGEQERMGDKEDRCSALKKLVNPPSHRGLLKYKDTKKLGRDAPHQSQH